MKFHIKFLFINIKTIIYQSFIAFGNPPPLGIFWKPICCWGRSKATSLGKCGVVPKKGNIIIHLKNRIWYMNRYDFELLFTRGKGFFFPGLFGLPWRDDLVKRSQASGMSSGRFPSCRNDTLLPLFCDVTCHGIWGLKWWLEKTCPHSEVFFCC